MSLPIVPAEGAAGAAFILFERRF